LEGNILLKNVSKHAGNKNINFKTKIILDSPNNEIIKLSQSGKFDDIVMNTAGAGSAIEEMLGSVSNYVLHKSKILVYLMKQLIILRNSSQYFFYKVQITVNYDALLGIKLDRV